MIIFAYSKKVSRMGTSEFKSLKYINYVKKN